MKDNNQSGTKVLGVNRKARFSYSFVEEFEAGIVLTGSEVKSVRSGRISFQDSHVKIRNNEFFLVSFHIASYPHAVGVFDHDPVRDRKLLLHRREITRLIGKINTRGYTIIPYRVYTRNNRIKIELVLATGKKNYQKKQVLKERDIKRESEREMARH